MCLVHVFRFKAHSDSRFLSVGETCRTLLRSMAVGIRELLKQVRCKPNHCQYYLHGWDRMDPHLTRMVVTICSFPPDAFLLQASEDDRQAMLRASLRLSATKSISCVARLIPSGEGPPASVAASIVLFGLMSSKGVWWQKVS